MITYILFAAAIALLDLSGWSLEPLMIKLLYVEDEEVNSSPPVVTAPAESMSLVDSKAVAKDIMDDIFNGE